MPPRPQYTQNFRKEWLKNPNIKDWLITQIVNREEMAKCKLCGSVLRNHLGDLIKHTSTKKHKAAESAIQRQNIIQFPPVQDTTLSKIAECRLACFIAQHSSILTIDHLAPLCKGVFKDKASESLQMHRTKCGAIIKNVLYNYFKTDLINDIGDSPYSLSIDESTDISVSHLLGMVIIYFSKTTNTFVTTFLDMPSIEECTADGIVKCIKTTLSTFKLPIQNLKGIGTDNASVMTGINNGVHKKLKEDIPSLVLIRCVCHSLQLAVSAAVKETLPRNLEFLIRDTYAWFSRSSSRQHAYVQLYKLMNDDQEPLKIIRACDTRWLSIESAVNRIHSQWLELKTHFDIARVKEKCYTADLLHQMYCDETNYLFIIYIKPILAEVQRVNKLFEVRDADPTKLLTDLKLLVDTLVGRITVPGTKFDILKHKINDYIDRNAYLGYLFEQKVTELQITKSTIDFAGIRERCINFTVCLINQIKERLPSNFDILSKINILSVENSLKQHKESIVPLLLNMDYDSEPIDKIEKEWNSLIYNEWKVRDTKSFWIEVYNFKDAFGNNPFLNIAKFAICMLVLPHSNAEVERAFSQMALIKTKLRNRMNANMLNAIIMIRASLKRKNQCCFDFVVPDTVLDKTKKSETYKISTSELELLDMLIDED